MLVQWGLVGVCPGAMSPPSSEQSLAFCGQSVRSSSRSWMVEALMRLTGCCVPLT